MHYCKCIFIYNSQQKNSRRESTNEQMQIMISNHRQQLDESRSEYLKLQNAYNHLEIEFRTIVKGYIIFLIEDEKDKYNQISAAHSELKRAFSDQQHVGS